MNNGNTKFCYEISANDKIVYVIYANNLTEVKEKLLQFNFKAKVCKQKAKFSTFIVGQILGIDLGTNKYKAFTYRRKVNK